MFSSTSKYCQIAENCHLPRGTFVSKVSKSITLRYTLVISNACVIGVRHVSYSRRLTLVDDDAIKVFVPADVP